MSPRRAVTEDSFLFHRVWVDYTVDVDAPQAEVETLLTDIDGWSSWTPGMPSSRVRGPVRVGARLWMLLVMKPLPPLWIPAVVCVYRPGIIEWGGGFLRGWIRHRFELTEIDAGRTRVRQVEYATNWLALVLIPLERAFRAHDIQRSKALRARFAGDRS